MTVTDFYAQRAEQAATQENVNKLFALAGDDSELQAVVLRVVQQRAADDHAQYPQYEGRYDGPEWVLANVTQNLVSKGGEQALRGDVVMMKSRKMLGGCHEHTFYSVRLGWDCSAPYGIEPVVGWRAHYESGVAD